MRITAAITGLLHLAVLAAPAIHEAFLEEERCAECVLTEASGPLFVEDCSGPCQNPDHHHHEGRHHKHACPLCQKSQVAGASLAGASLHVAIEDSSAASPPPAPTARPLLFAGIHPARAPPSLA